MELLKGGQLQTHATPSKEHHIGNVLARCCSLLVDGVVFEAPAEELGHIVYEGSCKYALHSRAANDLQLGSVWITAHVDP
jgi:hypothetical protein